MRQRKILGVLLILLVIPILGQTGPCGVVEGLQGPEGPQGPAGPQGPQGEQGDPGLVIDDPELVAEVLKNDQGFLDSVKGDPGAPGLDCWDLDGNGACDPEDDANSDGQCNALDCQGSNGGPPTGPAGGDLMGDYPNPEIGDGAVTMNTISSAGASAGDVITYNSGSAAWGTAIAAPKPLIEFAEVDDGPNLTTQWQTLVQVPITIPGNGKVHVIGNLSLVQSDSGYHTWFGIAMSPNDQPLNYAAVATVGPGYVPVTTQYVGSVGPGPYTFYLVGKRMGTSDTLETQQPQISVMFIPN